MINNPFGLVTVIRGKKALPIRPILALALIILLTACSGIKKQPNLATPETGKANVIGKVQTSQGEPYKQYNVRLAEVYWQNGNGAYVMDESFSPGGITDVEGNFQILNVLAGEYVVIVGQPNLEYKAITDSNGVLKRIRIEGDTTLDLGTIQFDY